MLPELFEQLVDEGRLTSSMPVLTSERRDKSVQVGSSFLVY